MVYEGKKTQAQNVSGTIFDNSIFLTGIQHIFR